jgi:hypothetical protein
MVYAVVATLIVIALAFWLRRPARPHATAQSKPAKDESSDPIDAFWAWWQTAKVPLAEAIGNKTVQDWVDPISEHVGAIDRRLAWELGPGVKSAHHICVSSEGDARLRVTAQRWLARAPAADHLWEYYPARQPSRGDAKQTIRMENVELAYADFRFHFEVDNARKRVHVVVYHPKLEQLSESAKSTAVGLVLDDTFGEDDVERWIGGVERTSDASRADQSREALREAVAKIAESRGQDAFVLLEAKKADGQVSLALVNFGLKRVDHILMDNHVEIAISYVPLDNGLCSGSVNEDLGAMEDALLDELGKDAVYIGHETGSGTRRIHLHAASGGPVLAVIDRWERMYPTWDIETQVKSDPQWSILNKW